MMQWYIMIIASLWLCFPEVTCAVAGPAGPPHGLNGQRVQNTESGEDRGTYFSQKNKEGTEESVTEDSSVKADEEATKREPVKREENPPKVSKELRPFVPSETIPAEQGVDFPYDI